MTIDNIAYIKLLCITHRVCADIRDMSATADWTKIREMADTIEFVPESLMFWRPECVSTIHAALTKLEQTYPDLKGRYTKILDMNDENFASVYMGRS
jgi:hypothetical protein